MHLHGDQGPLTGADPEELHRQLKKKQRNRAAAQRSRQKHTDKADALHQHEFLERHNHALRKEIQALQVELAWWSRTLYLHTHLCPAVCASCPTPVPPGCGSQAERPPGLAPHRCDCQDQLGLLQTPACSPTAQQLRPPDSPGLFPSPPPSLSLASGPAVMGQTTPAQLSPSPVLAASPAGSSPMGSSSKLGALLPSPPAPHAPPQPLGLEHPAPGKLGAPPPNPSAALGPAGLHGREHEPAVSAADWLELGVAPGPHPLGAFPLLSSAQVHF
ncbi:basic leucine zipper transcriptional factor ATF-like 2 isoform X2 [Lepus europaeus]|uniref:basic leucine zipper transcriptional factor ATF-like 2 isoform X2 n=1 Tax=Lepus europaeus TaxID=9983 RepID=UPI002B45B1CC|nr:basic leucine zipper transcriptional factor ATF-like 2 isoform X2 [Lepus europaeus]